MAIQSVKNQFRGINPHLHSYWQGRGGWHNFHNSHITYLTVALIAQLLPMGYRVENEPSLQIRRISELPYKPKADIGIYDLRPSQAASSGAVPEKTLGLVLPLEFAIEEEALSEKPYYAVLIYQQEDETQPVAWIELLSPSNKWRRKDGEIYLQKRKALLDRGIVFVELDYLHEYAATLPILPDYTLHHPDAHPYRIFVLDPRPNKQVGHAFIFEFDVDDPIPKVTIPLNRDDVLEFDFNLPYQRQYQEMLFGLVPAEMVDYSRLPLNFDRYSPADQLRIVTRLLTVKHAAERGEDLEQAPLPLIEAPVSLEAALAALGAG